MCWIARALRRLAGAGTCLVLVLGFAPGALAVGPFTHLILAEKVAPLAPGQAQDPVVRRALRLGALALDAGYYSDDTPGLGEAGHQVQPWRICRNLLESAQDDPQRAFALGCLSHALIDRLAHRELVNPLARGSYSQKPLDHKRVEWGLDCWHLARPENQWLWRVGDLQDPALREFWRAAVNQAWGVEVNPEHLDAALAAQTYEVWRLPRVFWLSGQTARPGVWWGNALGWALHDTLRPLTVAILRWRGDHLNEIAVLDARPARSRDIAKLNRLLDQAASQARGILAGGDWPEGDLDSDPACAAGDCPDLRAAQNWLRRLGATD